MSDNLVPGPQATIFDAVNSVVNDEQAAQAIMANPSLAKDVDVNGVRGHGKDDGCCGGQGCGCQGDGEIPLKAVDEIGRATAADVREALHQVIDPELGIDVVDLGLVYGIEIDELGLDQNDRRMLEAIIRFYNGGPVGLETLAAAIGEEAVTIEDVYEPYLMQIGFLSRTPRGRCITADACRHLGYDFPRGVVQGAATQPNLFDNK